MCGHSACELELADVVDDNWTENAGDRPRSQQAPMDRADMLRTEEIGEVGGHGREAPAIHGENHAEDRYEEANAPGFTSDRRRYVQREAQQEEDGVRQFAAEDVR